MIVLSAGHNKEKRGATFKGVSEYDIAVDWVACIAHHLKTVRVAYHILTSSRLGDKVRESNSKHPTLAIEVHFNACGNCGAKGSEILYCPNSKAGEEIAFRLGNATRAYNKFRGAKEGWYKMDRPGIVDFVGDVDGDENPDYFLRKTNCPAIILEPEFIHNPTQIKKIKDDYCKAIAYSIYSMYIVEATA